MNSQYHLLHAKRYLGASVASSIKHYHHHHHWHHHQKAPSLPPALTTTRCYSPSVSLSPSSKKKKERENLPPSSRDRGSLSFCLYLSFSLSCFSFIPRDFHHLHLHAISFASSSSFSPLLHDPRLHCAHAEGVFLRPLSLSKPSSIRRPHPSCPLRHCHRRHRRRRLRCGHPLFNMRLVLPLAYHVVTTCVDCCLHTHNSKL